MSLPSAFIDHYSALLPEKDAQLFFEYCNKPLRKAVRVNTLKYSDTEFLDFAGKKNWSIEPVPWCDQGYFIDRPKEEQSVPIGSSIPHALGGIYVQEASSMMPVSALFHGHENIDFTGKIVGDLAASPGSKTTQIASHMKGRGILLSNELSSSRLKALYSNLERCGVNNSVLTHYDAENLCGLLPHTFDFLLLDAPCTGEGTVRKNFHALNNWTAEDAVRMAQLQKKLIVAAFTALKEGGEMVYSTCTLGAPENSDVVHYLQEMFPESMEIIPLGDLFPGADKVETKEGFLQVWPQVFDTEGFFVAKIKKKQSTTQTTPHRGDIKKFPFQKASRKQSAERNAYFLSHWGCEMPEDMHWWIREKQWWLFPEGIEVLAGQIKTDRIGVKMGELHAKGWRTAYEFCSGFGNAVSRNIQEISAAEVIDIYSGKDLFFPERDNGELLLSHKGFPVSVGKVTKGKWKNALPRVLVRGLVS